MKIKYIILIILLIFFCWYFLFAFKFLTIKNPKSSSACDTWIIYSNTFLSRNIVFSWVSSKDFYWYCSPKSTRIDIKNYEIYICYESWWWSWECWAMRFIYNIYNNSWKYLDNWYFSYQDYEKYTYTNVTTEYLNNSWIKIFKTFTKNKNYNFLFQ